jgi:hypothetical protein
MNITTRTLHRQGVTFHIPSPKTKGHKKGKPWTLVKLRHNTLQIFPSATKRRGKNKEQGLNSFLEL